MVACLVRQRRTSCSAKTRFPNFPDKDDTQDLDDKLYLKRAENPTSDERQYDCDCATKEVQSTLGQEIGWDNYGICFDRDGVDPWQATQWGAVNGGTFNTGGVYQVQIVYERASNKRNRGTACVTIFPEKESDDAPGGYGIPTGFARQPDGSYLYFPYGLSFGVREREMKKMQVFVGGDVIAGGITVRNLTIISYR